MGAIAVSKKEEQQIERLRKELRIPTKAGVLRAALKTLEHQTAEERLRQEVRESVRRCAAGSQTSNADQTWASLHRGLQSTCADQTRQTSSRSGGTVQSLMNEAGYPSTIVIPMTSKLVEDPGILRFRLRKGEGALDRENDLLLG